MGPRRLAGVVVAAFLLGACSPSVQTRGHVLDPEALADLELGRHTRADVQRILGSPSTEATFRPDVWYYMSTRTETIAFLDPKVIERRIVAISFTEGGVIEDVVTYTEEDGKQVEFVSRATPTAGNELSIFQQLFGNLGRFEGQ